MACVHCAKHFIDNTAFQTHVKSKPHKRRMHALKTEPYSIEESERAAGMGSFIKPGKRKMETLLPEAVKKGETLADVKKRAKLDADSIEEEADEDATAAVAAEGASVDEEGASVDEEGDVKM